MTSEQAPTAGIEAVQWRCFHCDEVFTDEMSARAHFGSDESKEPACKIKAGAEGSLVRALREAENDAANAWAAIHNESTDFSKAYAAQSSRHYRQLQAAEEAGYEKGIRDMRAETDAQIAALDDQVRSARVDALEEAAKIADEYVSIWNRGTPHDHPTVRMSAGQDIADAIIALNPPESSNAAS